eukprot:CAMPEP_0194525828 /NCGR_PEP_ID=MMETSP0253-20130528/61438_1 /TAXON_ID=2966 /ORGANISM="Noctiluca scintillans" /LENGTH=171 /DNA_ID=CAMNT_0039370599 /DNA_START=1 /DNA_END=516 /DNA_ORIENTATION=+
MDLLSRIRAGCCCHEALIGGHLLVEVDQCEEDPFRSLRPISEPKTPWAAECQSTAESTLLDQKKADRIACPSVVNADERVAMGEEFTVTVTKDVGNVFGVKVLQSQKSCAISVKSVNPGLIMAWNETHPEQRVKVGDKLVSVNGVRGPTSLSIMQRLMQDRTLDLVFLSCS